MSSPKRLLTTQTVKSFIRTVDFDGTSRNGAIGGAAGQVLVAQVTGRVLILHRSIACTSTLVGATGTVQFGSVTNSTFLCAQTTATDIVTGTFWKDTSPEVEVGESIVNQNTLEGANATGTSASYLVLTCATAAITGGSLEIVLLWLPMSANGQLS